MRKEEVRSERDTLKARRRLAHQVWTVQESELRRLEKVYDRFAQVLQETPGKEAEAIRRSILRATNAYAVELIKGERAIRALLGLPPNGWCGPQCPSCHPGRHRAR